MNKVHFWICFYLREL